MGALAIMVLAFAGYIIMYQLYGKYIGRKIFALSGATRINLVMNNDKLSFAEAFRINKKLLDIGINIESILINKSESKAVPAEVRDEFNHQKIALFPFSSKNILGFQAINEYLDENSEIFTELK